ncbi:MAG: mannitol dehydrogenase family protein [Lachnospiraceae bacterium]|nr:mannitol dehydrogenase family protein [Lachnospiraceae bacterium]
MKLTKDGVFNHREAWLDKGYILPRFDVEAVLKETDEHPLWIHFGAGNIFRAFHANLAQKLLDGGEMKSGIIAADGFDYEIITKAYRPHDNISLAVTLKADGSIEKKIIASIAETHTFDREDAAEYGRLQGIFASPSLQLATFTITEKGYSISDQKGEILPAIQADFEAGPEGAGSYMGKVAALLLGRFEKGALPLAMVSTDNCSHNGDRLKEAVLAFAGAWADRGLAPAGFVEYVADESRVSFPWTMIDKITPRPDASVEKILRADGVEQLEAVITGKKSYVAPFVNAEESEYLVIEDKFPGGRPPLEKAGVYFTDRQTVDKVEKMKVCTCLNPLHTALAIFGCLLGYEKISEEMRDEDLRKLVEMVGYQEGLPVVVDPGIIKPKEFIDTVLQQRIPNPFMPDTPQRIATDTSQKLSIRFGETIKAYGARKDLRVEDLKAIPLVLAGWIRYLLGIDDNGMPFTPSEDPLLESAQAFVKGLTFGKYDSAALSERLLALLKNEKIFGVDLESAGLKDAVLGYLAELLEGPGAVRKTLHRVVS